MSMSTPMPDGPIGDIRDTVVHPDGDIFCNSDIALIVLDRDVPDATPMRVRMAKSTAEGEKVRAVGYGQNDTGQPLGTRLRRANVVVRASGGKVNCVPKNSTLVEPCWAARSNSVRTNSSAA